METLSNREVELGRVKFWYGLSNEALLKLADACPATVDKQLFKKFPQELYSDESAQRYLKDVICKHGNEVVVKIIPDNFLLQWAVNYKDSDGNCVEFDRMVRAMRSINPYSIPQFALPEFGNPYRASYLQNLLINDEAILQKIFYTCVLETSKVELCSTVLYLKNNKYAHPLRQIYDRNPLPDISYEIFEEYLRLRHAKRNTSGGSYPDTGRRESTKKMCEEVVAAHMHIFKKKDLCLDNFTTMVKEAMVAQDEGELFHKTAVMEFFRESKTLAPYRRGRGAPRKSKK